MTPAGVSQGLAFAPDGTLWGGSGGVFLQLDPQIGVEIGSFRQVPFQIGGMAFLPATPVQEPAAMSLLAAGLAGLAAVKLRRKQSHS